MAKSENLKKFQSEWFEFGEEDRINAKLIFNSRGAVSGVGLHLHQSVEKYLKGYLIGRGWELIKTHDLEHLLDVASGYDKRFSKFLGFGRKVSTFYVTDRYPPKRKLELTVAEMESLISSC